MMPEISALPLEITTLKIDGKKISNAVFDQIPQVDICSLMVRPDGSQDTEISIRPVCRFSLQVVLSSLVRKCKLEGFNADAIKRLTDEYRFQDEAVFFMFDGQLFWCTFSHKSGTRLYAEYHKKVKLAVESAEIKISHCERILELANEGLDALAIISRYCNRNDSMLVPFNQDVYTYKNEYSYRMLSRSINPDEDAKEKLALIEAEYGSFDAYLKSIGRFKAALTNELAEKQNDVKSFEEDVGDILNDIEECPFVVIGV
jgi:hypothetical protein